jgi:hypothetical protein
MSESTPKLCECGCGQPARIATSTVRARGWVKGEPRRFLRGHSNRRFGFETPEQRLLRETIKTETCWNWVGATTSSGYGSLSRKGRAVGAHVFSYEIFKGPLAQGLEIHHTCSNRLCVNPDHLQAVTHADHLRIAPSPGQSRKTHCKHGHPLSGDNIITSSRGHRQCRICTKRTTTEAKRRWRLRQGMVPRIKTDPSQPL